MSRSGYSEDGEYFAVWRGQVASAIRGKRGQRFLRELVAALDAMPEKRLVSSAFEESGEVCALGCLARARGVDLSKFDPEDPEVGYAIGPALDIAQQLAREVMYENDQYTRWNPQTGRERVTPEQRWAYMRQWAAEQIIVTPEECGAVELPDEPPETKAAEKTGERP